MKKLSCVLLVDDDDTTNFVNHRLLKDLEISDNIHTEYNGEKALNFLQFYAENHDNFAPELVLLDLKMPVLDGYEFLQYLSFKKFANKDDMKVVVLTTSTHEEDLDKIREFDIVYMNKPLTKEKVTELLQ